MKSGELVTGEVVVGLTREVEQELTLRVFEKGFKLDLDVQFPIATSLNKAIHFRNRKTPYSSAAKNLCLNGSLCNGKFYADSVDIDLAVI
ncbi:hypothetical protein GCM10010914_22880 [Deinococcus wulumuqiensis]|uniref:Nucleotidyltransferase domain-containing protein n=1 Tax=Deinococcus wulumuqiensis TaxID=980427 RepID=A0AAV4K818_9DEIO|nr:hypothetical protein GCM10010914_22880 [Deinococcus wulumuqiensis]GGP30295.1 hypothetical protein GCM10008021_19460 [Deinococcus wulumuqiensis]